MSANKQIDNSDWDALETALASFPTIIATWVFGSAQNGIIRPTSDVDVGVLWQKKPPLDDLLTLHMRLQDTLHHDNIDLITLNGASPILRFEAISGRAVYCRDAGERAIFASLTAREYEDEMAMVQAVLLVA